MIALRTSYRQRATRPLSTISRARVVPAWVYVKLRFGDLRLSAVIGDDGVYGRFVSRLEREGEPPLRRDEIQGALVALKGGG